MTWNGNGYPDSSHPRAMRSCSDNGGESAVPGNKCWNAKSNWFYGSSTCKRHANSIPEICFHLLALSWSVFNQHVPLNIGKWLTREKVWWLWNFDQGVITFLLFLTHPLHSYTQAQTYTELLTPLEAFPFICKECTCCFLKILHLYIVF